MKYMEKVDSKKTDFDLIDAYKLGDRKALNELVHRYFDRLERYGHKICSNREDAEEVLQETFAVAIDNLPDFRKESKLGGWLYKIASSLCLKKKRTKENLGGLDYLDIKSHMPSPTGEGDFQAADKLLEDGELLALIMRAAGNMPEKMKQAVLKVDFGGESMLEAAQNLGVSKDTLRVNLHRGRKRLRENLKKS